MTAIASLVFCNDCGNLLDSNRSHKKSTLKCDVCGATCKDTSAKVIVTSSKPADFPSAIRRDHGPTQKIKEGEIQKDALTNRTCENCGVEEVRFYTQQLRSADEGSTVFYKCYKCGQAWTENN